jgi:SAM-dependent methyltransferase
MCLADYRNRDIEKVRTYDLMKLIPNDCQGVALDVGARDGWFSVLLSEKFDKVTALDLQKPSIDHPRIECVEGDATNIDFISDSQDFVFCAEVLEHIPQEKLKKACSELERVARKYILIGVPYKQDIRIGRTNCYACGKKNPPWGHVNSFDTHRLKNLFPLCEVKKISFVGENKERTNKFSTFLMDLAGNPYGTYQQEEACIHCGAILKEPPPRNITQKIATKLAYYIKTIQSPFHRSHPNWIHILFEKLR